MEDLESRTEDKEIMDIDLKQEIETEVDDFYIGEYTPEATQFIGQKRKNTQELDPEILKKIKTEASVFEESSDVIILNTPNSTNSHAKLDKDPYFNEISEINEDGSVDLPHLFYISNGSRKGTIIFHIKIDKKCYELRMKEVCKKWCVLGCVNTKCKAQSKFALRSEFTQRKYQRYQTFNRMNYFINLEDPNLKNLSNWKVIQYKSKHLHSESCEVDSYKHLRRDFRAEHTEKAILAQKDVVQETLADWKSAHPEFQGSNSSDLNLSMKLERQSALRKIRYLRESSEKKNKKLLSDKK